MQLDALRPTGGTAIYDALVASAPLFDRRTHTRAALVVISDGADTASDRSLQQAREVVRRTDPFVYAIAIDAADARASTRVNPEALREITGPSGGYTEVVRSAGGSRPGDRAHRRRAEPPVHDRLHAARARRTARGGRSACA